MFSENFGIQESQVPVEGEIINKYSPDRHLFRLFNTHSGNGCLANKIFRNVLGIPVAVSCNCGKVHRVVSDKVFWVTDVDRKELKILKMNNADLIKSVWVNED